MADNPDPSSLLPDVFSPATRDWFLRAFKQPTAVQSQTWHVAARGEHALVIAPTGSGKTLAAFLYALDRLFREGGEDTREAHKRKTSRILYISPIKALGTDVQRNLQIPLKGIADERRRRGETEVNLRVGIRTGDTPAQERSKLTRNPPDILITTPESLYLMLTSRARETLRGVETVIIDEVHAVAGSKRGAHLALSLERLDALLHTSAQRIGLSATVRSASDVAAFLGGDRPVTVVNPPAMRHPQIRIVVPVANMDDVSSVASGTGEDSHAFCTLPMEDGCMNPGRWRLPGEYMPYGALTRRWSPVMTALLHVFLTPMVNCPMPRFFCLNQKSCCKLSARR